MTSIPLLDHGTLSTPTLVQISSLVYPLFIFRGGHTWPHERWRLRFFLDAKIVLLYSIISQALGLPGASFLSLYKSRSTYSSPIGLAIIYLSVMDFHIVVLSLAEL
jgi:hypothetical protein